MKDILGSKKLVKKFKIEQVNKSGAVFDTEKLDWLNGEYIRKMKLDELTKKCAAYFKEEVDLKYFKKVVALEQERIKR